MFLKVSLFMPCRDLIRHVSVCCEERAQMGQGPVVHQCAKRRTPRAWHTAYQRRSRSRTSLALVHGSKVSKAE